VLYFLGVVEIPLIFGGALLVLLVRIAQRRRSGEEAAASVPFGLPLGLLAAPAATAGAGGIFLSFLKIGSVLFAPAPPLCSPRQ
jgi:chromate transporter